MTKLYKDNLGKVVGLFAIAIISFGVGYLGGRSRIIGRIVKSLGKPTTAATLNGFGLVGIAPGPPQDVEKSKTYEELNTLLNRRLKDQYRHTPQWTRLLEKSNPSEQLQIKDELRSKFVKSLQPWPGPRTDLNPERELWFSRDGVDAWLVRLRTHPDVTLTCALLIPRELTGSRPGLLILHGMYGNLQSIVSDVDYHHGFGLELAKRGFVVLAPLRVTSTIDTRSTLYIKSLASGWNLEAIDLWQLVQAVDYLYSLKQVDRGHIGVYGISLGGQHALWLGAIDKRLSLIICSAYFTDRFGWLFKRISPSASSPPGDTMMDIIRPVDNVLFWPSMGFLFHDMNLVSLIQPRFFGVESGANDPRHPASVAEFEKVSRLYHHIGYPDRAMFMAFEGGHEVSVETTMPFLKKWIQAPPLAEETNSNAIKRSIWKEKM